MKFEQINFSYTVYTHQTLINAKKYSLKSKLTLFILHLALNIHYDSEQHTAPTTYESLFTTEPA